MAAFYGLCGIVFFLAGSINLVRGLRGHYHKAWRIDPGGFGRRAVLTRAERPVRYWWNVAYCVMTGAMGLWLAAEWLFAVHGPNYFAHRLF